jgi:hypothetical protein
MKHAIRCAVLATAGIAAFINFGPWTNSGLSRAQEVKTIPETIILAKDNKLGQVAFSHALHNNGTYKSNGSAIACIACHHTAQPTSEVVKHDGFKTSWPADRTTTLTAELFTKDPVAAGVAACRDCHAKAGTTPKLLPTIPQIKYASSANAVDLPNQVAFHKACTTCHAEAKKTNPDFKGPTAAQCTMCHKKAAA